MVWYNQLSSRSKGGLNMKIFKAYLNAFANWRRWEGRTRRRDYWLFTLANAIVTLILFVLLFVWDDNKAFNVITLLAFIVYVLVSVVPAVAITIRRLHDIEKSGYYYFLQFIPLVGTVWFIILMSIKGDYGKNKYGADPKEVFYSTGVDK